MSTVLQQAPRPPAGAGAGAVTVLVINLASQHTNVSFDVSLGNATHQYVLSPSRAADVVVCSLLATTGATSTISIICYTKTTHILPHTNMLTAYC